MTTTLYGIRNCDTCRKALRWLEAAGLPVTFHDFRRDGVPAERLQAWLRALGADEVLNRRSATWRKLDTAQKKRADEDPAALLREHPNLIRRPVLEHGDVVCAGFRESAYREILGKDAP